MLRAEKRRQEANHKGQRCQAVCNQPGKRYKRKVLRHTVLLRKREQAEGWQEMDSRCALIDVFGAYGLERKVAHEERRHGCEAQEEREMAVGLEQADSHVDAHEYEGMQRDTAQRCATMRILHVLRAPRPRVYTAGGPSSAAGAALPA